MSFNNVGAGYMGHCFIKAFQNCVVNKLTGGCQSESKTRCSRLIAPLPATRYCLRLSRRTQLQPGRFHLNFGVISQEIVKHDQLSISLGSLLHQSHDESNDYIEN